MWWSPDGPSGRRVGEVLHFVEDSLCRWPRRVRLHRLPPPRSIATSKTNDPKMTCCLACSSSPIDRNLRNQRSEDDSSPRLSSSLRARVRPRGPSSSSSRCRTTTPPKRPRARSPRSAREMPRRIRGVRPFTTEPEGISRDDTARTDFASEQRTTKPREFREVTRRVRISPPSQRSVTVAWPRARSPQKVPER